MLRDKFIEYLLVERRYAQHTLTAYKSDLEQFFIFINQTYGQTELNSITHQHIRTWVVDLVNTHHSNRSINRKLSTLKSFYKFLLKIDALNENPMEKVTAPKLSKRLPVYVEERQIETLLDAAFFDDTFEGYRDRLILEVLYSCGLRRSELNNLTWQQVDTSLTQIKVIGKGGKERIIPVDKSLIVRFEQLKEMSKDLDFKSDFVFTSRVGDILNAKTIYTIVKHYLSRIPGLEKKSPHVLRHTFATHLSNHGADLNAIKELLGHSNLAATQVYTHNSIEKLKKTFKQAHPRS